MKRKKLNGGITLIALVITIIVLLILAGISIATLTGDNGVLTKASIAGEKTNEAKAKEKVQVAVMESYGEDGRLSFSELKANLDSVEGIEKDSVPTTVDNLPINVVVDGYEITISENGKVIVVGENGDLEEEPTPNPPVPTKPTTIEEAKNVGIVLDEDNPTTITDTYGNEVKIPEGFKIAEDSATEVTGGIVIEDVSHEETVGSQFVWIPVGTVYTSNNKGTSEIITLDRYSFDTNGNPTAEGENAIKSDYRELATSDKGNTVAKNIEAFKTSVTRNKGYYMGRYEARTVTQRTAKTDPLSQVTVNKNEYVYNYITQPQAATLAREMYGEDKKFTSDLVNSYAWDTTIIFLQTFDNRNNKTKPYSTQTSLYKPLAPQGTNNITDESKQDKICNIWDMASNDYEWSTETYDNSSSMCALRGGYYDLSFSFTSTRGHGTANNAGDDVSFRPIIYF